MIRRLQRSADFERVLKTRTHTSSAHFAVHHLSSTPSPLRPPSPTASKPELSTGHCSEASQPVDESALPGAVWWGAVVPKRHARRSVTRSLLKRQIRAAVAHHGESLPRGLWVVRLRAPFDRSVFPSAASGALKGAAHDELARLLSDAVRRAGRA